MIKFILSFCIGLFSVNTAWAESVIACDWTPSPSLIPAVSLGSLIKGRIQRGTEDINCYQDEEGIKHCDKKDIWKIPNGIYSTSQTARVICINFGDKAEMITYKFSKASDLDIPIPANSNVWKNLTLTISGAGSQRTFSNIENMEHDKQFTWNDTTLAPCQKTCWDLELATPRYTKSLTFNFRVQPKVFKTDYNVNPFYDLQDSVGALWIISGSDTDMAWSTTSTPYLIICGLNGNDGSTSCGTNSSIGSGGGGGSMRPPIKQCTLTVVTPDVVAFQPISSDDLSRGRVRSEDFTMTVIKGPDQSTTCMGSAYNLPGEIKTQGGYPISSTFWGISHSSGAPQGIGLKLFDLGKGAYLKFNQKYSSFISDISSISESKRMRAEISATTKDLKKIKDGEYSQVLTFEVAMP
ncbi:hypothetical protein [Serratia fonticola]|uniref:hypothetical protein n=1 Tax=Serratia fonticola TaxID=47917 RepID=UPI00217C4079|nr:hypothetical protein [Serratia fonticola]CAI0864672.1 Uncharacterised protein [Serratia fonticola]